MSVTEPIRATRTAPSLATSAWRRRRLIAAVGLALAALVAFLAVPAYSAFDSIYSLVWGQEILRGELPSFDAYRAPTQHPLWVALSAVLAPFGDGASRLFVGVCVAGFVALVLGFFRLAEKVFNEPIAWIAALLLLSRLDYGFFAARAYVDVPFLALVIWAVALEAEKPRRGGIVWPMLIAAGLLRPEAWLLAGAYTLWMGYDAPWAARIRYAAWAAAAPVIWMASDWIVTGDPLYSLNYTTRSALLLGRRVPIEDLPERLLTFLAALTKLPVLLAGVLGVVLAWQLIRPRRRLGLPLFLLVFGVFVFLAISARGFAVIDRYLVLSALSITLFAAFTLGGWTVLSGGMARWRKPWAARRAGARAAGRRLDGGALQLRPHRLGAAQPPGRPSRPPEPVGRPARAGGAQVRAGHRPQPQARPGRAVHARRPRVGGQGAHEPARRGPRDARGGALRPGRSLRQAPGLRAVRPGTRLRAGAGARAGLRARGVGDLPGGVRQLRLSPDPPIPAAPQSRRRSPDPIGREPGDSPHGRAADRA